MTSRRVDQQIWRPRQHSHGPFEPQIWRPPLFSHGPFVVVFFSQASPNRAHDLEAEAAPRNVAQHVENISWAAKLTRLNCMFFGALFETRGIHLNVMLAGRARVCPTCFECCWIALDCMIY